MKNTDLCTQHLTQLKKLLHGLLKRIHSGIGPGRDHTHNPYARLAIALRSNDQMALKEMALASTQETIRTQAALSMAHQALLTAIALDTCDIELGRKLVGRIQYPLPLRRVACSARQDAIRVAAAGKLGHEKILKQIARTTADISLRWEIAVDLNDPNLMAEIALFKAANSRFARFHCKAKNALSIFLHQMGRQRDVSALLSFIYSQSHLPFKLMALMHLPHDSIDLALLQHLSAQTYRTTPKEIIEKAFLKIKSDGWQLTVNEKLIRCGHCNGRGFLAYRIICADRPVNDNETATCYDCQGLGERRLTVVQCVNSSDHPIEFRLPYSKYAFDPYRVG